MAEDPAAFAPDQVGWIDDVEAARQVLCEAPLDPLGFISDASNGTMLCRLGSGEDGLYAVYKPAELERPLWDFPDETLHRREVATFEVSRWLGWDLVPPTVLRDGPRGPGSLQLFVPHDPAEHYFVLVDDEAWHRPLARLAMFDMVTNNADRKGGHILRHVGQDRLYGIDNGLTFHPEGKLRTVVWDVPEVPFEPEWAADLRRLSEELDSSGSGLSATLGRLLDPVEVGILRRRADRVAGMDAIPVVHPDARHYPWPPV